MEKLTNEQIIKVLEIYMSNKMFTSTNYVQFSPLDKAILGAIELIKRQDVLIKRTLDELLDTLDDEWSLTDEDRLTIIKNNLEFTEDEINKYFIEPNKKTGVEEWTTE